MGCILLVSFCMISLMLIELVVLMIENPLSITYLVYLDNTPISWKFRKQRTMIGSLTKVKYKALIDSTAEILWLCYLLLNLLFSPTPMTVF